MTQTISEHRGPAAVPTVLAHPAAPLSLEETGLSLDLILQLVLKHMHFAGELTGSELARRLGLRFTAIETAVYALKSQHQINKILPDYGPYVTSKYAQDAEKK